MVEKFAQMFFFFGNSYHKIVMTNPTRNWRLHAVSKFSVIYIETSWCSYSFNTFVVRISNGNNLRLFTIGIPLYAYIAMRLCTTTSFASISFFVGPAPNRSVGIDRQQRPQRIYNCLLRFYRQVSACRNITHYLIHITVFDLLS